LIDACTEIFLAHEADILNASFDNALTDHCQYKEALQAISDVSIKKIYRAKHVVEIEASGHQILPGLLEDFCESGEQLLMRHSNSRKYDNLVLLLPEEVRNSIRKNPDNIYLMLRQVVDFVSGLTDKHALRLYRKIKGISL
jgi:dGTPase